MHDLLAKVKKRKERRERKRGNTVTSRPRGGRGNSGVGRVKAQKDVKISRKQNRKCGGVLQANSTRIKQEVN